MTGTRGGDSPCHRDCPLFCAAALLAAFVAACGAPPTASVAATPAGATTWRLLGSWSGRGDRQTESFDVATGAMRLTWETRNESAPGGGRLRVSLHSAISGRPLQTAVEKSGAGSGTAYLEDEPRVSYLVIESEQVDWTVTLEEAVPASARAGAASMTRGAGTNPKHAGTNPKHEDREAPAVLTKGPGGSESLEAREVAGMLHLVEGQTATAMKELEEAVDGSAPCSRASRIRFH